MLKLHSLPNRRQLEADARVSSRFLSKCSLASSFFLMGNCISNSYVPIPNSVPTISSIFSGNFEPPGSKALQDFVREHDIETDPQYLALKAAQLKAEKAERDARAVIPPGHHNLFN